VTSPVCIAVKVLNLCLKTSRPWNWKGLGARKPWKSLGKWDVIVLGCCREKVRLESVRKSIFCESEWCLDTPSVQLCFCYCVTLSQNKLVHANIACGKCLKVHFIFYYLNTGKPCNLAFFGTGKSSKTVLKCLC